MMVSPSEPSDVTGQRRCRDRSGTRQINARPSVPVGGGSAGSLRIEPPRPKRSNEPCQNVARADRGKLGTAAFDEPSFCTEHKRGIAL